MIKSLEEYEFSVLQEIPKDSLKTPTITTEEVLELGDLLKENVCLKQYLGEALNKHFYFCIEKSRYSEIMAFCGYEVVDEKGEELILKINSDEFAFNPLFKDKEVLDMINSIEDKRNEIRAEIKQKIGYDGWISINFRQDEVFQVVSKSKNIEEFKKGYEKLYEKAKAEYIEEVMGAKISAEDLEKEKKRRDEEEKQRYKDGERVDYTIRWRDGFVKGDRIKEDRYSFVLDKQVSKILPFGFWEEVGSSYNGDLPNMAYYLNNKKINYEMYEHDNIETKKKRYKVVFDEENIFVDGEKIPKAKLIFFLKRADGTKEKIKELKKLNGRAIQVLDKKRIPLWYERKELNLPFKAETTDGKMFKINFIMKEFDNVPYEILIPLFFKDRDVISSSPTIRQLFEFADKLGVSKADLFEHIRRIKMLGELDENN